MPRKKKLPMQSPIGEMPQMGMGAPTAPAMGMNAPAPKRAAATKQRSKSTPPKMTRKRRKAISTMI